MSRLLTMVHSFIALFAFWRKRTPQNTLHTRITGRHGAKGVVCQVAADADHPAALVPPPRPPVQGVRSVAITGPTPRTNAHTAPAWVWDLNARARVQAIIDAQWGDGYFLGRVVTTRQITEALIAQRHAVMVGKILDVPTLPRYLRVLVGVGSGTLADPYVLRPVLNHTLWHAHLRERGLLIRKTRGETSTRGAHDDTDELGQDIIAAVGAGLVINHLLATPTTDDPTPAPEDRVVRDTPSFSSDSSSDSGGSGE